MARDRLATILESMAKNKTLKISQYRIYLCLFSRIREGLTCTEEYLSEITGLHYRTLKKQIKDLVDTGNIEKGENGTISITFDVGDLSRSTQIGAHSTQNLGRLSEKAKVSLLKDIKYKIQEVNEKYKTNITISDLQNINPRVLDSPIGESKAADPRFKILVDKLFELYEEIVKEKMNPLFGKADGAMLKRLLKNLPEEKVDRLVESFKNFLLTNDEFDAQMIRRGPVRYWATRVTEYLPEKEIDLKALYKKMRNED